MFGTTTIISLASMALSVSASCMHGTSHHRREVSAEGKVAVSKFGYSGDQGPLSWAALAPENSACRTSKVQSPIVLDNTVSKAKTAPKVNIPNVEEAEFENLGTTLETIVNGTTTVDGKTFNLKQFHLHTPSEHRINDEYFPLEMHMVHEGADGSIAVIAIPFQLSEDGSTTKLLDDVTKNLKDVVTPGSITKTGALDFGPLTQAIQTKPLFQYTGSLTTPPCAEGLTFLVMEEPLPINVKTFNALKKVIKFNARYSQNPLGEANLLDLASDLKIQELGISSTGRNGSFAKVETPSTSAPTVDAASLAALFAAIGNASDITVHTTTTTETKLLRGGKEVVIEAPKTEAPKEAVKEEAKPAVNEAVKEETKPAAAKETPKEETKEAVAAPPAVKDTGSGAIVVGEGSVPAELRRLVAERVSRRSKSRMTKA